MLIIGILCLCSSSIYLNSRASGKCSDINRLLPPDSPFLRFPDKDWKKEIKVNVHQPVIQPMVLDEDKPRPTCPFPQKFYDEGKWSERAKYDWIEGGEECDYLPAPVYPESQDIRKSIGGSVRRVIRSRPKRLLKGDFIAFATRDEGFAFYVARIEMIRIHSIFVQFYGDTFLGELILVSFIYLFLGPYKPCLEYS